MIKVTEDIYSKMINDMPIVPPERGGILGAKDGVISEVFFDCMNTVHDRAIYIPEVKKLNEQLTKWGDEDIQFAGLFHSHKNNSFCLSKDDLVYIETIIKSLPDSVDSLLFPIVIPKKMVIFYSVDRKLTITKEEYEIIDN